MFFLLTEQLFSNFYDFSCKLNCSFKLLKFLKPYNSSFIFSFILYFVFLFMRQHSASLSDLNSSSFDVIVNIPSVYSLVYSFTSNADVITEDVKMKSSIEIIDINELLLFFTFFTIFIFFFLIFLFL